MTLLGVQTAEESMLKHIAQRGILGSMAEKSVVSSSSSVTSNGELSEEDPAEYLWLVRHYQDEPLAGEEIPRKTKTNSTLMGPLRESCRADTKEPWLQIPSKCIAYPVSFSSCSVRRNWRGDFVYVDNEAAVCPIFL